MTTNPDAPDMPSHKEYCEAAAKWLRRTKGCIIAAAEIVAATNERPDALGFKSHNSFMVEVKMSRADFMADKKKWHRQEPGRCIGDYRYYFCPPEVLFEHDMPAGWGLIWYDGKKCRQIVKAERMNDTNHRVERTFLISIIRRLKINCEYIKPKIAWPVHRRADLAPQGPVDVEALKRETLEFLEEDRLDFVIQNDPEGMTPEAQAVCAAIDHLAHRLSPCPHKRIDHNGECLDCDEPVWAAPAGHLSRVPDGYVLVPRNNGIIQVCIDLVSSWHKNPNDRHPSRLGVTIKTDCGTVYEVSDAAAPPTDGGS